jgi:hypothetical protein
MTTEASGVNYRKLVDDYIKRFGEEVGVPFEPLDGDGYTRVKRGSALIGINVLEKEGVLLFLSAIMKVPDTRQLELYRKLLELNFLRTSDGAFAIDGQTGYVYLRAFRGLQGIDYVEFVDMLETVAQVADDMDDKLKEEFGDPA